jgi:hypothetical protein
MNGCLIFKEQNALAFSLGIGVLSAQKTDDNWHFQSLLSINN